MIKCDECAWSKVSELLPFCVNNLHPENCPRFFPYEEFVTKETSEKIKNQQQIPIEEKCGACGKMKDVGKSCWWCGG